MNRRGRRISSKVNANITLLATKSAPLQLDGCSNGPENILFFSLTFSFVVLCCCSVPSPLLVLNIICCILGHPLRHVAVTATTATITMWTVALFFPRWFCTYLHFCGGRCCLILGASVACGFPMLRWHPCCCSLVWVACYTMQWFGEFIHFLESTVLFSMLHALLYFAATVACGLLMLHWHPGCCSLWFTNTILASWLL